MCSLRNNFNSFPKLSELLHASTHQVVFITVILIYRFKNMFFSNVHCRQ